MCGSQTDQARERRRRWAGVEGGHRREPPGSPELGPQRRGGRAATARGGGNGDNRRISGGGGGDWGVGEWRHRGVVIQACFENFGRCSPFCARRELPEASGVRE